MLWDVKVVVKRVFLEGINDGLTQVPDCSVRGATGRSEQRKYSTGGRCGIRPAVWLRSEESADRQGIDVIQRRILR